MRRPLEFAANAVSTSLQRTITVAADQAFLNSPSDHTGLRNITGVVDAGTVTDSLDPFLDGIAAIQENYGNPSAIVMDPKSWAVLGNPVASAARTLFSLPIYITPSMTAGNALIVSKADLIAAVGTIDLTTSTEAAFSADSLVHRITRRIGWNTVHANRFAKLAITLSTQG
ncbi:phage major capsid protein [Bifidobacterium sp.]|uniref:phage major capsid family protein n=1 Tax=unclassified Bifidobacterium TaxID=2608897 RepID=UPI002A90D38B|nr:phage major capsid protein [Bifidobacterium sp.]MDY5367734.1 phage major capsid protein [Bifidobacterium sp.]